MESGLHYTVQVEGVPRILAVTGDVHLVRGENGGINGGWCEEARAVTEVVH